MIICYIYHYKVHVYTSLRSYSLLLHVFICIFLRLKLFNFLTIFYQLNANNMCPTIVWILKQIKIHNLSSNVIYNHSDHSVPYYKYMCVLLTASVYILLLLIKHTTLSCPSLVSYGWSSGHVYYSCGPKNRVSSFVWSTKAETSFSVGI